MRSWSDKQGNEGNGFKHRLFGDVKHPVLREKTDFQIALSVLHIFVACGCQRSYTESRWGVL